MNHGPVLKSASSSTGRTGDPLILIPERGDMVCMAAWHLPESAVQLNDDEDVRYTVLGEVVAKLADVEMSQKARAGVKDALAALGYEE
jgi:hypothetical protein